MSNLHQIIKYSIACKLSILSLAWGALLLMCRCVQISDDEAAIFYSVFYFMLFFRFEIRNSYFVPPNSSSSWGSDPSKNETLVFFLKLNSMNKSLLNIIVKTFFFASNYQIEKR